MHPQLLTPGQFAKLARTTKRTVLWYDAQDLLQPAHVADNGYRLYEPRQIIDFQVILLLRNMRFSIEEIKTYLGQSHSLHELFKLKETVVRREISDLTRMLASITTYYHNLEANGTLSDPSLVTTPALDIYYIAKEGPYMSIKDYCLELKAQFATIPRTATFLTLFFGDYEPRKATMHIAVIALDGMRLKKRTIAQVEHNTIPSFKALKQVHNGSGALVSLLWRELEKYAHTSGFAPNNSLPFSSLEVYKKTSLNGETDENRMVFELYLPVR